MIARKLLLAGLVVLGVAFALLASTGRAPPLSGGVRAAAGDAYGDFDGQVDVRIRQIAAGENLVQILDRGRSIVCYGKMNLGGAATISCQKFSEASKPRTKL